MHELAQTHAVRTFQDIGETIGSPDLLCHYLAHRSLCGGGGVLPPISITSYTEPSDPWAHVRLLWANDGEEDFVCRRTGRDVKTWTGSHNGPPLVPLNRSTQKAQSHKGGHTHPPAESGPHLPKGSPLFRGSHPKEKRGWHLFKTG